MCETTGGDSAVFFVASMTPKAVPEPAPRWGEVNADTAVPWQSGHVTDSGFRLIGKTCSVSPQVVHR